jgi:hypothetical protein
MINYDIENMELMFTKHFLDAAVTNSKDATIEFATITATEGCTAATTDHHHLDDDASVATVGTSATGGAVTADFAIAGS